MEVQKKEAVKVPVHRRLTPSEYMMSETTLVINIWFMNTACRRKEKRDIILNRYFWPGVTQDAI